MNDDTEILKVTKFHDAMIRSITGQSSTGLTIN